MNTQQTTQQNADYATLVLEQALAVVEGSFYQLRDEVLDSDQLFEMRIRLADTADAIAVACKHIEALQRAVDLESAE